MNTYLTCWVCSPLNISEWSWATEKQLRVFTKLSAMQSSSSYAQELATSALRGHGIHKKFLYYTLFLPHAKLLFFINAQSRKTKWHTIFPFKSATLIFEKSYDVGKRLSWLNFLLNTLAVKRMKRLHLCLSFTADTSYWAREWSRTHVT